ncbi:hypothetical protein [Flavonifractor sp. An91]|uniref:hypothetical protein n=1 Tax=Flavonifractor sp. An91 TaxID=1965665 RepID=UPI000B3976F7|nr:hypothetical protein [Flavonifractor sp. An91]OUN11095.1 hypothetical protein B5G42_09225 [Flavonifractor sp. An91]
MIDYIGQLLEQQLEREERDGVWKTGPVRVPLPAVGEEEAGQSGENTEEAVLSSLEGRDGAGLALTAGGSGTVTGGDIRRWAAGLDVLGQAGERRTNGGPETDRAWTEAVRELDQAVRISLAGLPVAERQTQVVTLEPPGREQNGGQDGLRRLDRLVRRDARRFDGGFQLL